MRPSTDMTVMAIFLALLFALTSLASMSCLTETEIFHNTLSFEVCTAVGILTCNKAVHRTLHTPHLIHAYVEGVVLTRGLEWYRMETCLLGEPLMMAQWPIAQLDQHQSRVSSCK